MIDELVDRLLSGDDLSEQDLCILLLHPLPLSTRIRILTTMVQRAYLEQGRPASTKLNLTIGTSLDPSEPVHVTIHDDAGRAHIHAYFPPSFP